MERRIVFLSLLMTFLVSCSQGGFQEPIASTITKPQTTYSPEKPTKTKVGSYDLLDGVTKVSDLLLKVDGPTAQAVLTGTVTIRPVDGNSAPLQIPINVAGIINSENYSAYMTPSNKFVLDALQVQVGVKLMCLYTDCSESFMDIYINYKGRIYHHQVKSTEEMLAKPTVSPTKGSAESSPKSPEASSPQTPKQNLEEVPDKAPVEQPKKDSGKDNVHAPVKVPTKDTESTHTQPPTKQAVQEPMYIPPFLRPMKPAPSPTATPKPAVKPPLKMAPQEDLDPDGGEFEHDSDGEEELGTFVGEPEKDVEVFFPNTDLKKEDGGTSVPKDSGPSEKPPLKPQVPSKNTEEPSLGRKFLDSISQAIGPNSQGRLENAANLYKFQQDHANAGFNILYPKRETYYGTTDMLNMMSRIGQYSLKKVDGYIVSVGDVSKRNGGKLGGHASHQRGLDADISYYFDNEKLEDKGFVNVLASSTAKRSWMPEKQWDLFKTLVSTQIVDRIFMDRRMKQELCEIAKRNSEVADDDGVPFETLRVISHVAGHANHFHLRLKCSKAQPRCQQMAPPKKALGC